MDFLLSSGDSYSIASLIMLLVSDSVDVDVEVSPSFTRLGSILGGNVGMKLVGDDGIKVGNFKDGSSEEKMLSSELGMLDEENFG